ncbi:MAG: ATP-dependent DNA helicase [Nanoarchaeota archaeon]
MLNIQTAIERTNGPCIVLAGAGTGKTKLIVDKIKYIIENKIYPPEKIVCLTFSNEAADNILKRVRKDVQLEKEPIITTFHAFSSDILKKYGEKIGIKENFHILDSNEAKILLNKGLKVKPYYCKKYISTIGTAKDLGISLENLQLYLKEETNKLGEFDLKKRLESLHFELQTMHLRKKQTGKRILLEEIGKINELIEIKKFLNCWSAYEKIKIKSNYLDYADLNKNALELLTKHPEIAKEFDYILVDEFQDTNKVQLDIIFIIAYLGNITIVGDLNQSIYMFRGAYKDNFYAFKEYFKASDNNTFNLDKSYRSSNKILRAAHKIILNNYIREEECFEIENAEKKEGENIEIYKLKNSQEEARKVIELIERELSKGIKPEEICVMFRTHQQGRIIKKILEERGIVYQSASKKNLLRNKAVKIVIDYLIILDKIWRNKKDIEAALWDLVHQLGLEEKDLILMGKTIRGKKGFALIMGETSESMDKSELSDFGKNIIKEMGLKIKQMNYLSSEELVKIVEKVFFMSGVVNKQESKEEKEKILNLNKFLELVKSYTTLYYSDLRGFINYLESIESLDIGINEVDIEKKGVQLMTLHSTKGLEYKTVILTNFCKKRFPIEKMESNSLIPEKLYPSLGSYNSNSFESQYQLSEERRLCYVAFTRAKDKLVITYAGEYGGRNFQPSKFLEEIEYLENKDINFRIDEEDKYRENIDNEIKKILIESSKENKVFSPSSLITFSECQKKYQYKYVYNIPEKKNISWELIGLGSFVHNILEKGVKEKYSSLKEFIYLLKEMHKNEEWESIDIEEAEHLIKVFYERNKEKYNANSKTEQTLKTEIDGISFIGFADRIDYGENGIEIIDYKTGKSLIPALNRNWQLGYYALAAKEIGKVYKLTLDMLKQEKPLEFFLDENGNAVSANGNMHFNIYQIKEELVKTAKEIESAYINGFNACTIEKNCDFCNEYVYNL